MNPFRHKDLGPNQLGGEDVVEVGSFVEQAVGRRLAHDLAKLLVGHDVIFLFFPRNKFEKHARNPRSDIFHTGRTIYIRTTYIQTD